MLYIILTSVYLDISHSLVVQGLITSCSASFGLHILNHFQTTYGKMFFNSSQSVVTDDEKRKAINKHIKGRCTQPFKEQGPFFFLFCSTEKKRHPKICSQMAQSVQLIIGHVTFSVTNIPSFALYLLGINFYNGLTCIWESRSF